MDGRVTVAYTELEDGAGLRYTSGDPTSSAASTPGSQPRRWTTAESQDVAWFPPPITPRIGKP